MAVSCVIMNRLGQSVGMGHISWSSEYVAGGNRTVSKVLHVGSDGVGSQRPKLLPLRKERRLHSKQIELHSGSFHSRHTVQRLSSVEETW